MKIGLFTPLRSPVATPEFLKEFGQKAESMGIHSFWLGEHVVLFNDYESKYPGSSDGVFRFPNGSGLMDMVSSIGFLAACTSTLRLGTGICILPQNNPVSRTAGTAPLRSSESRYRFHGRCRYFSNRPRSKPSFSIRVGYTPMPRVQLGSNGNQSCTRGVVPPYS